MNSQSECDNVSSSSGNGSANNSLSRTEEPPLWNYVIKLEKQGVAGGTWKFKCKLYNERRQGSYSRVKAHLLGLKGHGITLCKKETTTEQLEMQRLEDEFEKKKSESRLREVPLACESEIESDLKKRMSCFSPIIIVRLYDNLREG
ncbi:hypothetical protein LIER_41123 [Lithospermum erythrorhizon]|uniref:Uncharacterized protein n=1 Tax=Lithospermum erythrorhizon TaxID=34254 RepID=A0AAV3R4F1_LITER